MKTKPLFVFFLSFLFAFSLLPAQDCLPGWDYYRPLTIDNSSGDLLTDVQIRFDLNVGALISAGKLQPSLSDLRILDTNCNPVHFYIDSSATDSVRPFWVKVPALAAGETLPLELYYGNSTALSEANGDSTFIFFDDFEDNLVDPAKWEAIGAYVNYEAVDGVFNYSSTGSVSDSRFKFVRTAMRFEERVHFDLNAKISNSNGFGFSSADSTLERILFRISGAFGFDTLNQVALNADTINNGFATTLAYPFIRYPRGQFTDATMLAGIEENLLTIRHFANLTDNSSTDSVYQATTYPMSGFHLILSTFAGTQTIYLDYLRVRKYVPDSLLPATSIGAETMLVSSRLEDRTFRRQLSLSPNPTHDQLSITGLPTRNVAIRLVNTHGQVALQHAVQAREGQALELHLPTLNAGLYWISFADHNGLLYAQSVLIR